MKCPCCGKIYDDNNASCPVCKLENFCIAGDYEEGIKLYQPIIEEHKKKFYGNSCSVGIKLLKRNSQDSNTISSVTERVSFGKIGDLIGSDTWLANMIFAFPDSNNSVAFNLEISKETNSYDEPVTISGMNNPGMVRLGIHVNEDLSFCIKMKQDGNLIGVSDPIRVRDSL